MLGLVGNITAGIVDSPVQLGVSFRHCFLLSTMESYSVGAAIGLFLGWQ